MKKSLIPFGNGDNPSGHGTWLDLEKVAAVELSSEDPRHQFEATLDPSKTDGWKASVPGPQLLRILFHNPQAVSRIHLEFREESVERSQEFAIFVTTASDAKHELVRQQWSFSPQGSTTEIEDYSWNLQAVTVIEIEIDPGRHNKNVFASLRRIQVG